MIRLLLIAALLPGLLLPLPAHAWGALGHRLVARLGEYQLAPEVRSELLRLLATEGHASLADVSTWADELRATDPDLGRRSAKWHYVNIGEHDCQYEAARDCPGGDCIVEAIDAQLVILGDRDLSDAERLQALKFVVHFVGDAHQPMHAGYAHDRGGNTYQVNYRGRGSNLHSLWDGTLLNSRSLDEDAYFQLLKPANGTPPAADPGAPAQWATEACRIVLQPGVYPQRRRIDDRYLEQHRPLAEQALQRAGQRLAARLNQTLR